MAKCTKIRPKKRRVCIGGMDKRIKLHGRELTAPAGDSVDYAEQFIDTGDAWAAVETKAGETIFDSTGQERDVTHRFYIRFREGVTAQTWILWEGIRYNILTVEDLEERHEFLLLRTTKRGPDTKNVNAS